MGPAGKSPEARQVSTSAMRNWGGMQLAPGATRL
jgi:hypothetical protein